MSIYCTLILLDCFDFASGLVWHEVRLKQIPKNEKTKMNSRTNGSYKIRQIIIKIIEYTYTHIAKSKQFNTITQLHE